MKPEHHDQQGWYCNTLKMHVCAGGLERITAQRCAPARSLGPSAQPEQQFPRPLDTAKHSGLGASCQVFLSHAGPEKRRFVAWLSQSLWAAGVKNFLDERALELGDDAPSVMEREACTSQVVICVLTREFFERKWPLQELHWAMASHALRGAHVIPVFLEVQPDPDDIIPRMRAWLTSKSLDAAERCEADVKALCNITGLCPRAADG